MKWRVTGAPSSEPLTLAEAKAHIRRDDVSVDDSLINGLISEAREYAENYMERAVMNQEVTAQYDRFADRMILPRADATAITEITYLGDDGTEQTLSTDIYGLDAYSLPSAIYRKAEQTWPTTRDEDSAVTVVYQAGMSSVPHTVKRAMLLLIGHWYENREAVITGTIATPIQITVDALLNQHRVRGV